MTKKFTVNICSDGSVIMSESTPYGLWITEIVDAPTAILLQCGRSKEEYEKIIFDRIIHVANEGNKRKLISIKNHLKNEVCTFFIKVLNSPIVKYFM